ncbi:hypothetical protein [Streptomyces sp. NPDC000961]|uniref:hypothetical protein n=1 Tax=Streptomyces sp. NPDC000961 TaxID=3364541 RepID=UPI003681AE4C
MPSRRSYEIMAALRGGSILDENIDDLVAAERAAAERKADKATLELWRQGGGQTTASRRRESQRRTRDDLTEQDAEAAFERRVSLTAQGERISMEAARALVRRQDAEAKQQADHLAVHEEMNAINGPAAMERKLQEAKEAAAAPLRGRYLPDGRPAPGTTVNDLIADGARNPMAEKLRVAYYGSWDDLAEIGLV